MKLLLVLALVSALGPANVIPATGPALPGAVNRVSGESDHWPTGAPMRALDATADVPSVGAPTIAEAKAWALRLLGARQYACLGAVVRYESRWRVTARNRTSGAYGLPQALPGSKMAKAGADWRTNPVIQLRWLIEFYLPSRYGTACRAWVHVQRMGWY